MTGIPPSSSQQPLALGPQAVAGATVATVISANVPPQLAGLELRALIEATVLGLGPGSGTVQIAIEGADAPVTLRLALPAPAPGASLSLQMLSQGNAPQLRVVSIDGQPPSVIARPGAQAAAPTPMPAPVMTEGEVITPLPSFPSDGAALRPIFDATLVRAGVPPVMPDGLMPTELSNLPAGTVLTVRLASSTPPAASPDEMPPPPQTDNPSAAVGAKTAQQVAIQTGAEDVPQDNPPQSTSSALPQAQVQQPPPQSSGGTSQFQAGPQTASPLPAGQTLPPAQQLPPAPSVLPDGSFEGVVAANSNCGLPLLQTPFGLISLDAQLGLPAGSRVVFELLTAKPPDQAMTDNPNAPEAARNWPALGETMRLLSALAPAVARQLSERLPELGPHLALGLIAFAASATKGELWKWLGQSPAAALEKAQRQDLVSQLESELGQVAGQVYVSPNNEEWLAWMVPLMVDGKLEKFRMMARRHASGEERARRSDEGARFLLDLDLSATGKMQIDGLVKRAEKRFDLIVRTYMALPQDMRVDIRGIFARSLDGMGYAGEAVFQQTTRFVEPMPMSGSISAVEI